jgi:hypothetical protein
MSMGPTSACASPAIFQVASLSATSAAIANAVPPFARTASTSCSNCARCRATATTFAPFAASCSTSAAPRPRLAPVTNTFRFLMVFC